jgi:hypothetical protein
MNKLKQCFNNIAGSGYYEMVNVFIYLNFAWLILAIFISTILLALYILRPKVAARAASSIRYPDSSRAARQ